jgi:ribonuclease VapC
MVIATSALFALLLRETNAAAIAPAIEAASPRFPSAASPLECSMVIETRKREAGSRELNLLLYCAGIEVIAVDQDHLEIARVPWRRFGNGRHPAVLTFGDYFSYAWRTPARYLSCSSAGLQHGGCGVGGDIVIGEGVASQIYIAPNAK